MNCYEKVEEGLRQICAECKFHKTNKCVPSSCNIGFASNAISKAVVKGQQSIRDGIRLIPKGDMKVYEENSVARSIANVCKLCKQCRENHSENCIIALSRRALERTCLGEDVVYPGNVLMYLINVAKQDPVFSGKIKNEYSQLD